MFYLSEAPSPLMTPDSPSLTNCIRVYKYIYSVYSHREGRGGGELTSEKVSGTIVHKAGSKIPT